MFSSCEKNETLNSTLTGIWDAQSAEIKVITHENNIIEESIITKDEFDGEFPLTVEITANKVIYSYLKEGVLMTDENDYRIEGSKMYVKKSTGEEEVLEYNINANELSLLFSHRTTPDFGTLVNIKFIKK